MRTRRADGGTTERSRDDWFVRAAGVVGDFGNPFYADERQRDVWNEASAVGLQVFLWLSLAVATGAVWLVGGPAVPFVVTALVVVGVTSWVTVAYAQRLGVEMTRPTEVLRPRLVPYLAVVLLLAVGVWRAAPAGEAGFSSGFGTGIAAGSVLGLLLLVATTLRARRRERAARQVS